MNVFIALKGSHFWFYILYLDDYLDDLLNIDNPYFEGMVNRIYPLELQLNKANTSDTEAPFFDLHLSISNGFSSSKIYDKRDDFDFDQWISQSLNHSLTHSLTQSINQSCASFDEKLDDSVVHFDIEPKSILPTEPIECQERIKWLISTCPLLGCELKVTWWMKIANRTSV